jgi:hypothetical protein
VIYNYEDPKAYLIRIVSNESVNYLRGLARDEKLFASIRPLLVVESPSPEQTVFYHETEKKVHEAVERLPLACRRIYRMSREELMRIPEIASELNLSNSTVKNQLVKALKSIRLHIGNIAPYQGADKGATYTYQLNLTPDVYFRTNPSSGANPALFDLGNDEIAWNMGYRNIKFYPDSINTANKNQNNDVPVFRYADILLMKAEAILRGASATGGQTALSLANQVRAGRTTSAAWTTITLDSVYNERCREFTWETWHRNDMIRFGKYEGAWGFKTNTDVYRRIFPIPNTALLLNPKLTQNPGY